MIVVRSCASVSRKTVAVEGIDFAAADGAITTLLGGNGSGKTTTACA